MKTTSRLFLCLFSILFTFENCTGSMIADITQSTVTEFGTYEPYLVSVTPAVQPYIISADFSNVTNLSDFNLSDEAKNKLKTNGFVATPSSYKQIYDFYNYCKENEKPIFVTTDAMLHTFHILYDYSLRIIEIEKFVNDLKNLNRELIQESINNYNVTVDTTAKELAKKNVAYFTVAGKLLDESTTVQAYVDTLVNQELTLIGGHAGFSSSPIFGYDEDYSQYVPRGHYTRNATFEKYFKSMMWYGRIMFRLKPGTSPAAIQKGKDETFQAILIVKMLNTLTVNNEPALAVWDRIYAPTVFFVGKSDDLNVNDYTTTVQQVWGGNYASLSVDSFHDDSKLTQFIDIAAGLRNPYINSSWVEDWETAQSTSVTKGFRFMGQRFVPDSYMFQELVYNKVMLYTGIGDPFTKEDTIVGPIRAFPRGLDVLSILGSDRALEILTQEGDTQYNNYSTQMTKLKNQFTSLDSCAWAQNLYWNWLYCLMPLLSEKGDGYPSFMRNQAWTDKQLSTSLGSWAELRHDTILYAKQSYTIVPTSPGPGYEEPLPGLVKGYVEPNPHLYARLASLAKFMKNGLNKRGLLLDEFKSKFESFETLLVSLKTISEKELSNSSLTSDEYVLINMIGDTLEGLLTFEPETSGQIENDTDEQLAVIADVHTYISDCLEEGVGYPMNLYVIVPIYGKLKITCGSMFSYYEFKQPSSSRLTDEEWQTILSTSSASAPSMPSWTGSFNSSIQNYSYYRVNVLSDGKSIEVPPEKQVILYPNPFKTSAGHTKIFFVDVSANSVIRIYTLSGNLVKTIEASSGTSGIVEWDVKNEKGEPIASGVYICVITNPQGEKKAGKLAIIH